MKPKVVFIGNGIKLSMITLDLADAEEALALARQMVERTGRSVTVRDANGEILKAIEAAIKH
jgi:hypothetical protein